MKIICVLIAIFAAMAFVGADSDYSAPRAFYRLDPHGNSERVYFSPNNQRRLRRQVTVSGSSSSSSSSSGGFGQPTHFSTSGHTYTSPGIGLGTRFGGNVPGSGVYHATSGYLGSDGQIYYTQNQSGPL